jgi:hypothetical protein
MTYRLWFSCMEVRSVRLQDLNFEDEQLKVVHRNGKRPLCVAIQTSYSGINSIF